MGDTDLGQRVYSNVDEADGRLQAKIVGNASSAVLGASAEYQQLVDSDGNARVLVQGNDANGDNQTVRLSKQGAVTVDGVYDGTNNADPGNVGLVGMSHSGSPVDSQQTLRITAVTSTDTLVRALDVAIRDEAGNPFSNTNPLPVAMSESEGDEICEENTKTDLGSDLSDTQDYQVDEGVTFRFKQVLVGCAGDHKVDVLIGDGASPEVFTRKALRYGTPSKDASFEFSAGAAPVVVGTVNKTTVRVIRWNMDNKQTDISTTIVGVTE